MIISHRYKFVFFVNPETGSEALEEWLAPLAEEAIVPFAAQTPDSPYYHEMSPPEAAVAFQQNRLDLAGYTCITCTENPFTRLPRLFQRITEEDRFIKIRRLLGAAPATFETWLAQTSPTGRGAGGALHQRWRRFGTWTADHWSRGIIDHVIRREHIQTDLAPVVAGLNLPIAVPEFEPRPAPDYPEHLSRRSIIMIGNRYSEDIKRFGYALASSGVAA